LGPRSKAPEVEIGIERKPGFDFGSCFIESPQLHQNSSHTETSGGVVWGQYEVAVAFLDDVA